MNGIDRRELLGLGLLSVVMGGACAAERAVEGSLTSTERDAIRWGRAEHGLQAGLRLLNPKRVYRLEEQVELVAYLRNRTGAPVQLFYYYNFQSKTPGLIGPDGEPIRIGGITDLAAIETVLQTILPPHETLVVEHPGFWLMRRKFLGVNGPFVTDPKPGRYRISQTMPVNTKPQERYVVRKQEVALFSADGKPRRGEANFVPLGAEDLKRSLETGAVEITVGR